MPIIPVNCIKAKIHNRKGTPFSSASIFFIILNSFRFKHIDVSTQVLRVLPVEVYIRCRYPDIHWFLRCLSNSLTITYFPLLKYVRFAVGFLFSENIPYVNFHYLENFTWGMIVKQRYVLMGNKVLYTCN